MTTKLDREVNLIVTSPPYNLSKNYGGESDDQKDYQAYLTWTQEYLKVLYDMAAEDGRLCLNIPLDTAKPKTKGTESGKIPAYWNILLWARVAGWKYTTTIVWNEGNISRRTAWGSWMSASAPCVTAPAEMILVMHKGRWKRSEKGESDITREEFMAWTLGVWTFNGENAKRAGHPAPFPLELPTRCIKLFSYVGDTVLDPFAGSGTTLVACQNLNRYGIGIEIESTYCELANRRLKKEGG